MLEKLNLKRQVFLLVASFVALALIAGAVLTAITISRANDSAAARQGRFASLAVRAILEKQPIEQQSSAVWSEAVERVRQNDQLWISENLGVWMQEYFGHDENYVLTPQGNLLYASRDGLTAEPAAFDAVQEFVRPLFLTLKAEMREASDGDEDSTAAVSGMSTSDIVRTGEAIAFVSLTPIVPDNERTIQAPGSEFVHVAIRYATDELAEQIAEPFELDAPAFVTPSPTETMGTIPLVDARGQTVGWFTWTVDRPAVRLLRDLAPVIGLVMLLGTVCLLWMARRLSLSTSQLQVSEAHARFLSLHDPLTGLPNRALFDERLSQALRELKTQSSTVGLLCVDLDRFKHVNDSLGHAAGDELVRQASNRLVRSVRETDTVARLGGDEFAIVLPGLSQGSDLLAMAEKVVSELSTPYELMGSQAHVSASVGAVSTRDGDNSGDELLRRADIALYRATEGGRARACLFAPEMDEYVQRRFQLEQDLRAALESGSGLNLVYQPLFDAEGQMLGAEALARWDHPQLGALSPEIFIPLAEERRLIGRLGLWALQEACKFAASMNLGKIAVNVSPTQLRDELFPAQVIRVLDSTGLAPARLELELTEKVVLERDALTQRVLKQLRTAGITIALDDFATGNSSLAYVREYGVDRLKIDRSFINRLGTDEESDRLVQAIVSLAQAMGLSVTAEGIETDSQRTALIRMGCQVFQGYLLGRPMDGTKWAELASTGTNSVAKTLSDKSSSGPS